MAGQDEKNMPNGLVAITEFLPDRSSNLAHTGFACRNGTLGDLKADFGSSQTTFTSLAEQAQKMCGSSTDQADHFPHLSTIDPAAESLDVKCADGQVVPLALSPQDMDHIHQEAKGLLNTRHMDSSPESNAIAFSMATADVIAHLSDNYCAGLPETPPATPKPAPSAPHPQEEWTPPRILRAAWTR